MRIIDTNKFRGTFLKNLTRQYQGELTNLVYVKNAVCNMSVYVKMEKGQDNLQDIRVYALLNVSPTHTLWLLVAQGKLNSNREITFYSLQSHINEVKQIFSLT